MATITTILASDIIASSRVTLNTNFANLNTDKVDINSTYADPAWITSLAGSKITGNIGGNAATATALATARTIAGVSFDGTANIAIPSSGLSDSSDIVRGASSVDSGQVLYGTAPGVAGTSANLSFSNTASRLTVGNSSAADNAGILTQGSGTIRWQAAPGGGGAFVIQNISNTGLFFNNSSSTLAYLANNGNLLIGTTTDDGTNRLQVAGSVAATVTSAVSNQDGATSLRLATSLVGTAVAGTPGSRITFAQRWANTDAGIIRVGAINGWKTASDGAFGGGIQLLHQPNSNVDMAVTLSTFQTGNVAIGTTTDDGTNRLQVAGGIKGGGYTIDNGAAFGATDPILYNSGLATLANYAFSQNGTGETVFNGLRIDFRTGNNNRLRVAAATGNIIVGGTTDNNFRFDIASSGSSGTFRAYDQTPTTGVTQVIVRAGAGQSTTNLQTWQNAAGTTLARVEPTGRFVSDLAYDSRTDAFSYGTSAAFNSGGQITWGPNATTFYSPDVAIRRRADGVLEINNGTAGTFRDLFARGLRPVGSTVANLPAAAGNAGMLATVTDATVTTIGTTVAGGGGNTVLVWSNGTNWRIYAN